MTFNDTSTKLGLIQDCEMNLFGNYADISGSTNRLYDFTARINRAYDKVANLIMSSDGKWEWDDTNHTELPIGTTDLVSGQQNYTLDVEYITVSKVIIYDSAGNKHVLQPIDRTDPGAATYLTDPLTITGQPIWYDKMGVSLRLYPIPNYDYTGGLEVYFQRKASYFAYTDTTKNPGIPSIFHRLLSLEASLDYAISKQMPQKNDLAVQVKEMEDQIVEFYSKRSKDEAKYIYPAFRSSR
jgi:hypothetical protein